jgi:hypothetical protein
MGKRKKNERSYNHWVDLAGGGRRYWYDVPGADRGMARYVKIVDADERTLEFCQEIYDDAGHLIEIHRKYPADTGHQIVGNEGNDS